MFPAPNKGFFGFSMIFGCVYSGCCQGWDSRWKGNLQAGFPVVEYWRYQSWSRLLTSFSQHFSTYKYWIQLYQPDIGLSGLTGGKTSYILNNIDIYEPLSILKTRRWLQNLFRYKSSLYHASLCPQLASGTSGPWSRRDICPRGKKCNCSSSLNLDAPLVSVRIARRNPKINPGASKYAKLLVKCWECWEALAEERAVFNTPKKQCFFNVSSPWIQWLNGSPPCLNQLSSGRFKSGKASWKLRIPDLGPKHS